MSQKHKPFAPEETRDISPKGEIVLEGQNLTKSFQVPSRMTVFENLSLSILKEKFVALIGRSGCGKTTLLRVLAGLEKPDSGRVNRFFSQPSTALGMVFQQPGLLPWRTIGENIRLPLELCGDSPDAMSVTDASQLVGLNEFQHYFPHQVSGGMKSRAAIARALALKPQVLLMDEPFGALDEFTRSVLHLELVGVWEKVKTTVLFVTHSISEAVALADTIMVMAPDHRGGSLESFNVDMPRPRPDAYEESEDLRKLCKEIRKMLWNRTESN